MACVNYTQAFLRPWLFLVLHQQSSLPVMNAPKMPLRKLLPHFHLHLPAFKTLPLYWRLPLETWQQALYGCLQKSSSNVYKLGSIGVLVAMYLYIQRFLLSVTSNGYLIHDPLHEHALTIINMNLISLQEISFCGRCLVKRNRICGIATDQNPQNPPPSPTFVFLQRCFASHKSHLG